MPAPRKSPLPAVPGVREGSSAPEGLRAGGREAVLADAGEPHSQPPELRGTDFLFSGHGSVLSRRDWHILACISHGSVTCLSSQVPLGWAPSSTSIPTLPLIPRGSRFPSSPFKLCCSFEGSTPNTFLERLLVNSRSGVRQSEMPKSLL